MGDYADMMLDGTCCQICGQVMNYSGGGGFPATCVSCQRDGKKSRRKPPKVRRVKAFTCDVCNRKFTTEQGLMAHDEKVHPPTLDTTWVDLQRLIEADVLYIACGGFNMKARDVNIALEAIREAFVQLQAAHEAGRETHVAAAIGDVLTMVLYYASCLNMSRTDAAGAVQMSLMNWCRLEARAVAGGEEVCDD